jgi:hypothetical protein
MTTINNKFKIEGAPRRGANAADSTFLQGWSNISGPVHLSRPLFNISGQSVSQPGLNIPAGVNYPDKKVPIPDTPGYPFTAPLSFPIDSNLTGNITSLGD